MKVQNIGRTDHGSQPVHDAAVRGAADNTQLIFQKTLTKLSAEQYNAHIEELVNAIDAQGEKLSQKVDITEFEKYRELIRSFLDEVVSNGYSFSKENALGHRSRNRIFATVKTINSRLDELAKEVLEGQADSISMLDRIGEIRGLILDLML